MANITRQGSLGTRTALPEPGLAGQAVLTRSTPTDPSPGYIRLQLQDDDAEDVVLGRAPSDPGGLEDSVYEQLGATSSTDDEEEDNLQGKPVSRVVPHF